MSLPTEEREREASSQPARLATVREIAADLRISIGSAYALIREGALPGVVRITPRRLRIDRDVFDAWIAAGGNSTSRPGSPESHR